MLYAEDTTVHSSDIWATWHPDFSHPWSMTTERRWMK